MPIRRPSASAGQPSNFFSGASNRAHKSTDSHHVFVVPGPSIPQPPLLSMGNSASPQQKVVHVLVNRLKTKLPCNSGLPLDKLESDPLTLQAIETLVELSHDSLDIIAWALSELADRLAKQTDSASGHPTIETLQSQLFVLKVLSMTMASRWNANQRSASRASDHASPSPDSPQTTASFKRSRAGVAPSVRSTWSEPAPLDDSCAKYILSVMVLYLRQTTTYEVPLMLATPSTDLSFRDFELHENWNFSTPRDPQDENDSMSTVKDGPQLRSQPSSSSVRSVQHSISSVIPLQSSNRSYEKTHLSFGKNSGAVSNLIAKYTGRIIFHISATNWSVVYNRLRTKIRFLGSHPDDNPDTVDLQLMAHSVLDRQRLVNLLNDLSSLLVNMGKEAQLAIAISLRTAVWNWIDRFPHEFNEAVRTRGRTEGAPERVFDLIFSMATPGHERIFWPCLTILSCITYDRISADFQPTQYGGGGGPMKRKEQRFGQELLKHIRSNSKLSEIALTCAVDMCRVAAYVDSLDEVPLKMIASDMAHEIQGALWNGMSRKAFWDLNEEIDVGLYADALISIFRFLPQEDSIPLFAVCLEPDRSEAVKTCVIRAALTLDIERLARRIPSEKSLERLQDTIARRCRDIVRSSATRRPEIDQYGNPKRPSTRPKGKRPTPDPLHDRDILVLSILSLWRSNTFLFLNGISEDELSAWISTTAMIWDSPLDDNVKISTAACLRKLTRITFTAAPSEETAKLKIECFRLAIPRTLSSVSTNLLNERVDIEAQMMWTSLAVQFVDVYTKRVDMDHVKQIQRAENRIPALTLAEIAFMVALPASNVDISHLAARGLRLISLIDRQADGPPNKLLNEEEMSKRNSIYEQLGDPRVVVVGRVGHQRRIRKLIRVISYNSPVHPAVWTECYSRWRAISQPVYDALNDGLDNSDGGRTVFSNQQELRAQWQNLTLFLATLCGTCTWDKQEASTLLKTVPIDLLPDKMRVPANVPALAETFIGDLINLLMHRDALIRDTAREALGSELSPKFYPKLIRFMDDHMRGIGKGAGPRFTDDYILFLDQFISVLRLLADDKHGAVEDLKSLDVSSLMHSLAGFIARYDEPASHRIKIKFCGLCTSICDGTDTLTMRKNDTTRNDILDIVLEWLQPIKLGSNEMYPGHIEPTFAEMNLACLRTVVTLLEKLQLRAPDVANNGGEEIQVMAGTFKRYSDRLLQCLDTTLPDEQVTSDSASDLGSVHQRMRTSQKESELRNLVITGLTHLVSTNSENGFKQCLHLAYDPDSRKRTIFAHVFARVIGGGTKFESSDKPSPMSRYSRFADLLRGHDMVLAMTICEICPPSEVEVIINVLFNIFDTKDTLLALLKLMIEREISQTENEASLFRSNSTCTRLLSAFARTHGYAYLRNLIKALIDSMNKGPDGTGFDIDPYRIGAQDLEENRNSVDFAVNTFLGIIGSSSGYLPAMLREICIHIGKTMSRLYPESTNAALGAFIFLRVISPAIVSPEIIDIELPKENEGVLRKGLMNVGKVIQSLANHIFLGKELPPSSLDPKLEDRAKVLLAFLEMLQQPPTQPSAEKDEWSIVNPADDTDIVALHRFFDKHADKIGKELLSLSKPSPEGDVTAVNGKRAWDGLCALLVDLGTPLEVPKPSSLDSSQHPNYRSLMTDCDGRNVSRVRKLFVEIDVPPNQVAIFIIRANQVDIEDLDIQTFMYHFFKTLMKVAYVNRPFDIIFDCTNFKSKSEVPIHWVKYCVDVFPSDIRSRFRTAHILNPSLDMKAYLAKLHSVSAGPAFCSEIKSHISVEHLLEFVPDAVIPELTWAISTEEEIPQVYIDVSLATNHTRVPIEMALMSNQIRITTHKVFHISLALSLKCVEIIPLSDVLDIYNIMNAELTEFVLRRRGAHLYFTSPNRDAIVKHIRSLKGKLKEVQAPLSERFSRFSNIPATLLHIGFLSVDPNDEELRSAAYDLLGAVCSYLKYDKSPIVARKAGFIPGDPFAFVTGLSEKLADFAPELTLDFIHEISAAMTGMSRDAVSQRIRCLHYMSPWIRNLSQFASPTSPLFEKSLGRLRDCVRTLTDLSLTYPEIISTQQKFVWGEMGKLDAFVVDVILDELVRTAVDGGIGTKRCELICQVSASLSSISVRSRMYSKLRKALGRSPTKVVTSLTAHPNWNEVSTLIRLISALGSYTKQPGPNQLFVPEVFHLVTLSAGEGPTLVRKSVYGIVMNLLQALYISRSDDISGPELLQVIDDCSTTETLQLFGLMRETPTSEYSKYDPMNDREHLDNLERFVQLLLRIAEVASGSRGLLNIWRARWMSLVTATAFQFSPVIQARSFTSIGELATSDVDDDFVYQIMVALKVGLSRAQDNSTVTIVGMLRCLCRLVPTLMEHSRYIPMFFWLGVSLLQTGHPSFFAEASILVRASIEVMEKQGSFRRSSVSSVLLETRLPLEDITIQFDEMLNISFENNFSLSLSHIIFKGVRHSVFRESAEGVLRTLLQVTARSYHRNNPKMSNRFNGVLCPDIVGYFLALLPLSSNAASYHRLLKDCMIDEAWQAEVGLPDLNQDDGSTPRPTPPFLGINDSNMALMVSTTIGTMLGTAQGDDAETEMLYDLLSELSASFPDVISQVYESVRERVRDTFANSSNAAIIRSVSTILRVHVSLQQEMARYDRPRGSSQSTLNDRVDEKTSASADHLAALDELCMRGLAYQFTFLVQPEAREQVLGWIKHLVQLIACS